MVNTFIQTPKDFEYEVLLYSDRVNMNEPIILTASVGSFEIYESINIPFMTAKIAILDTDDLENRYKFLGTELIMLFVKLPGSETGINNIFNIVSVDQKIQTNDTTKIITLNLIEYHGYLDRTLQISKMYDGKPERIIQKIVKDQLDRDIDLECEDSFQPLQRLLIPYINPLQAVSRVLNNISTDNGLPYFLYSTLTNDNLILKDLETMVNEDAFNKNPFRYSRAFTESIEIADTSYKILNIENLQESVTKDTLLLAELGVYGSSYSLFDVQTGKHETLHFNILNEYDKLGFSNKLPEGQTKLPFDTAIKPKITDENGETLDTYDSRNFYKLAAQTYAYEDGVYTFGQHEKQAANYMTALTSSAFRQILFDNELRIRIGGLIFLLDDAATIGNSINIAIPPNTQLENSNYESRKSGKYIITAKRQFFNTLSNESTADLTISRITELG